MTTLADTRILIDRWLAHVAEAGHDKAGTPYGFSRFGDFIYCRTFISRTTRRGKPWQGECVWASHVEEEATP